MLAAMLLAILGAVGFFCVAYQKQVATKLHARFEKKMTRQGTPTPAPRAKAPEVSLTHAVTIKTPDGAVTIPMGARVRVIEKSTLGMVAVNYQGYTAPIPVAALSEVPQ